MLSFFLRFSHSSINNGFHRKAWITYWKKKWSKKRLDWKHCIYLMEFLSIAYNMWRNLKFSWKINLHFFFVLYAFTIFHHIREIEEEGGNRFPIYLVNQERERERERQKGINFDVEIVQGCLRMLEGNIS